MKFPHHYSPTHKTRWKGLRAWKRHGLVLLVGGAIYVVIGLSLIKTEPTKQQKIALHYALNWMSFDGWGVVFIIAGVLAIISSRWPPVSETWGYTVLTGLSAGWAAFYWVAILFGRAPDSNIRGVLSWGLLAFMWWAISGLRNPPDDQEEGSEWTPPVLPASSSQELPD